MIAARFDVIPIDGDSSQSDSKRKESMGSPVVHFEIVGKDQVALQTFYTSLFGWQIDDQNPMHYGMVATGGNGGINGGITTNDQDRGVTIYVEVADLGAALTTAERLGGKIVMPPMDSPGAVSMAMFSDPAGNVIGLTKADST